MEPITVLLNRRPVHGHIDLSQIFQTHPEHGHLGPDVDPSGVFVTSGRLHVLWLILLSAANAWLLNIFNFLVTVYTSPVTLQVLGNVKSCISILVSCFIFGNSLNFAQAI